MQKMILTGAAVLMSFMASITQAQEVTQQNQLSSLFVRTEARAKAARLNFERLIADYPEFLPELQQVAARLETHPEWLLNVMACESSFVASAHNPLPGQTASGLLQFIRQTAVGLGTTPANLRRMSPVEQLRFVERYLTPFKGHLQNLADVYLVVFRGFSLDGGPEKVVAPLNNSSKERSAYSLNRGLDINGDRQITKGELALIAFGVGRFSIAQPVNDLSPQIGGPPQDSVPIPMQSPASGRYVVIPARAKSELSSSPSETFGATTMTKNKTHSTYIH